MPIPAMTIEELIDAGRRHECDGVGDSDVCVVVAAVADLPSRFGDFQVAGFWNNRKEQDHAAFISGNPCGADDVLVRLHSECVTGDVAGSLRCDCRDQLEASLVKIAEAEAGIVLYLRQEGRGIGFTNKVRAYGLQDQGLDTVEANLALGFADDEREYAVAAHMLHSLDVRSIRLMTNNPSKVAQLTEYGVKITERVPHVLPPNKHNIDYLRTKARKSGHFIDPEIAEHLLEQDDKPILE